MTEYDRNEEPLPEAPRQSGWRRWLGLGNPEHPSTQAQPSRSSDNEGRYDLLPAKRRLLSQVSDFLIDHDLEILPFTLTVGYECVTGGNPRLTQRILERTEKGLPVTLAWLEEASATHSRDATAEAMAELVGKLELTLADVGKTMAGARDAAGSYSAALEGHVADLQEAKASDDLVARLTTLTRRMLDHTRSVEGELAASEARIDRLQQRLEEARRLANHDHLTGLPNRRAFDGMFEREMREARLAGEGLCVAFCDIDHFKRINDVHGHPAGDRVIRYVADVLGRISLAKCHVARHGGEEFAVLLRGVSVDEAWAKLDAARAELADKRLVNRVNDMPLGRVTFSGGIADVFACKSRSAALKAADDALYAAKNAGRNCIVIAGRTAPRPLREAA
ncbi:diguanylate cyclase [Novosphingobium nitrogenifigens DSM 19370]|uniref:diguanylate cyclase n=1 Tax=Novosphingobium nitrogenifigens DSM 19370 TaxID=983920 RepID=F1ZAK6_9SPHN|nr:GGDEF domain-containing protein [Novosphingobium nitrogenifigens]EGD58357.1 diguanylate cyclase [Novosphingobium nitrogenifigens DSM 19370]